MFYSYEVMIVVLPWMWVGCRGGGGVGGYSAERVGLRRGSSERCGAPLSIGVESGADAHADGKGRTPLGAVSDRKRVPCFSEDIDWVARSRDGMGMWDVSVAICEGV